MKERSDIKNILGGFQKFELKDFVILYDAGIPLDLKKADLVNELTCFLVSRPQKWLRSLTERDLRLLEQLVSAGPDKPVEMDFSEFPSLLIASGLIDINPQMDYEIVWLRHEVYDIVSPYLADVIREGERTYRFELERLMLGYLNLYGVMPYKMLYDLVDKYVAEHMIPHNLMYEMISSSPLLKMSRFMGDTAHGDELYVASPLLDDPERLLDDRSEYRNVKKYAVFTDQDALEAGSGAPFCAFGLKTEKGKALLAMLRKLRYEETYLTREAHDIWMNSQDVHSPEAIEDMYGAVTDVEDELTASRYRSYLQVIADYANSLPKWLLSGHSSAETGYLTSEISDAPMDDELMPADEPEHWSMPHPTISEGYSDLIESDDALDQLESRMPDGFPFGMAIPHVAPDDPCPCGSGLKYCRCHGKVLS